MGAFAHPMLFGGVWGNVARLWGGLFAAMRGQNGEKSHQFEGRRGETAAKMGHPNLL
jgi:hypothetical protein